jgi:hypothetical protein
MKSGLGTGILILSPVFPFSLEVTSFGASDNRPVDGGGMNDDDDDDDDDDTP